MTITTQEKEYELWNTNRAYICSTCGKTIRIGENYVGSGEIHGEHYHNSEEGRMNNLKLLEGMIPCVECDGKGFVECEHAEFDHGICMDCSYNQIPDLMDQAKLELGGS